jgi:hypothetical protein
MPDDYGLLTFSAGSADLCLRAAGREIKVSRTEVKPGDPVTVSWETKNAKKIEVNGE